MSEEFKVWVDPELGLTREKFDRAVAQVMANGAGRALDVEPPQRMRLSPTEQIEAHRARRWLKRANRDVADRVRRLSTPKATSDEFLRGVQELAKARWFRDKLAAKVL